MHLKNLETFLVLASCLNFTKCAEELYISQSAISRQISNLEEELGCQLFERDKRSVSLTPYGYTLMMHAQNMLQEVDSWQEKCAQNSAMIAKTIRIGMMNDIHDDIFSKGISRYLDLNAQETLEMNFYSPAMLIKNLLNDTIDFAFTLFDDRFDTPDFESILIKTMRIYLALPSSHPLAKQTEPIELGQLSDEVCFLITKERNESALQHIDKIFNDYAFTPKSIHYSTSYTHMLTQIQCGQGFTFIAHVDDVVLPQNVVLKTFESDHCYTETRLIWHRKKQPHNKAKFIEIFKTSHEFVT